MRRDPGNAEPQLGTGKAAKLGLGAPGKEAPGKGIPSKDAPSHRGWYSRGYLPHLDSAAVLQSITFRLADSLPQEKLRRLEQELADRPESGRDAQRRRAIEAWLDAGMGCCALRHPEVAAVTQETLLKFDGQRYRLLAWCVMPNHVHVLIEPTAPLAKIVQSWKSFTGRWALAHDAELGLAIPGKRFWMRDYWDRYIRDQQHLDAVVAYIHDNPVAARLCGTAEAWPWSSARNAQGAVRGRSNGETNAELELGTPETTA